MGASFDANFVITVIIVVVVEFVSQVLLAYSSFRGLTLGLPALFS